MSRNSVVRLTDRPDMTLDVDWDVKQQNNKNNNNIYPYNCSHFNIYEDIRHAQLGADFFSLVAKINPPIPALARVFF